MVDGHYLVVSRCELGVDGTLDGLLDDLRPLLTAQLNVLLVHRLAVRLADLEHERPVGTGLLLGVAHVLAITLSPQQSRVRLWSRPRIDLPCVQ